MMVMLGTDAHKRSHTIVAVDPAGVEIGSVTVAATTDGHLRAMQWAAKYTQRQWAIEDCLPPVDEVHPWIISLVDPQHPTS
jgi:hypothetical protein